MKVTINNKKFIDNKYTYVVCYYIDFGGNYEFANSIEDIEEDDRCYVEFPFKALASQFLLLTDEMVTKANNDNKGANVVFYAKLTKTPIEQSECFTNKFPYEFYLN